MLSHLEVKKIDISIEEEVIVSDGSTDLVVFANVCPYPIEVGRTYPVSLSLVFLDELTFQELSVEDEFIERVGDGFSHVLAGKLENERFYSKGFEFECDDFEGMDYLNGKFIKVEVDRISAEFK